MHGFVPPRSASADRKAPDARPSPLAGPRPAQAPRHFPGAAAARREAPPAPRAAAEGGLPEGLRLAMEAMSGFSLADVVVHRNSSEPAKLGAFAYAQGADIHLGPGQEKHLPHEAWHVVQQKQGRVRATLQAQGVPVNDDPALEAEADHMGALASRAAPFQEQTGLRAAPASTGTPAAAQLQGDDDVDMTASNDIPSSEEGEDYHPEDDAGSNPLEELQPGDLNLNELEVAEQRKQIAAGIISRSPELFEQFSERARLYNADPTADLFLLWFNSGIVTRSQFARLVVQRARTGGTLSHQPSYVTANFGPFTSVTYLRDNLGGIDFSTVHSRVKWRDPIKSGSIVNLTKGSSSKTHGVTLSGHKIKIAGAERSQHFSIANRILNNGFGCSSPTGWTWHHMITPYKMVLVDRVVHAKHGHNGGNLLWS